MAHADALRVTAVRPSWAVEGGRVDVEGVNFPVGGDRLPDVTIGGAPARVVFASGRRIGALVPAGLGRGRQQVRVDGAGGRVAQLEVGTPLAAGIHQVDNPAFDRAGNLYVTYSGSRGQQAPVSVFRVRPDGERESFVSGIVNATSLAFSPQGVLHISSRFEGTVYRVDDDGRVESVVTDLGVACGLAFGPDGTLFVGDRSGTIFRLTPSGQTIAWVTLPPSVAAYHLAFGPDQCLYVTAPTLDSCDAVYRISPGGQVEVAATGFGRPQGLAFDSRGVLHVVEALAGGAGLYRVDEGGGRDLVVSGIGLVGVAFDPVRGLVVSSNDTAYRLDVAASAFKPSF